MALTLVEELQIINGDITPSGGFTSGIDFKSLVLQSAYGWAVDFINTQKDTTGNADAASYRASILQIARTIVSNNSFSNVLGRVIIAIYGETGAIATVTSANESAWEGFIDNNMNRACEALAGIIQTEKTAYDSI